MDRKKILVWGEAGVGKTTFCSKFLQDWALVVKEKQGQRQELTQKQKSELEKLTEEQKSKLNNIGLLFYIVLRDIGSKTIKDIIISKLGLNKLNNSQLLNILEHVSEKRKIVIVMDGFDEISEKDEQVQEVLLDPMYHNVHSITTCRPHATRGIFLNVDVEIRLMGFSEAQAKAFVEMYARIKYSEQDQIVSFVKHTMGQIESSAELLEMSTNPSMLQLLCLLSWKKVKIGKNRTSVFKYYTRYLLMQYHIKLGKKKESYSDDLYKQNLLDAGKVALMGLKQNQLELVFSKSVAHGIGGDAIFDIGLLTELPGTGTDDIDTDNDTKVQFTHKTLQEYLAAYYVVNSPGDEGLQHVMEFCCTSQRLMGSEIILEFVSNMSTKIGKKIQKQIQDYVSKWDPHGINVDPKNRTSFLISMLKGNKTLIFPLPAKVEIDLREFDFISQRIRKFFKFLYRKKSTLETFFAMDGTRVKKVFLTLGEYNRMNVLKNTRTDSVNELTINYCKTWSKKDNEHLHEVMKKMKPKLLSITECQKKLMDKDTIAVILEQVHTLALKKCDLDNDHLLIILKTKHHLKILTVNESGEKIDGKVIEAVSKLSSDIKLYISGKEITLIHNHASMKSLNICNCGIRIDTEIAEAVSRIPEHTKLDLSGNQVTDKSACITLVHKAATMTSLKLCKCGIEIDTEIAEAVSRMPDDTQLDLSGNHVTDKSACIALIHKATTMESLNIHNCMSNSDIEIDTEIAEAVSRLPDHTELDLSGNWVTDKSACFTIIHKAATMKSLNIHDCMSNCGIQIDMEIAEAVSRLPDHSKLDLSGNRVTDKSACFTLIHKAATMKSLNIHGCMSNCGIQIDMEIAEAVSRLPDHSKLDLSGNRVTDKSACFTLIHKAATMKSLNIHGCMSNCGIKIDTEIAEAVSRLPDHIELDLSGNQVTDKSACITLIHKAAIMKSLSICNCDIQIDTEIAEAVSRLPDHTELDLSGNDITMMEPSLLSRILLYMKKQEKINIYRWEITVDEDIVIALSQLSMLQTLIINYIYNYNNNLASRAASQLPHTVSSMPHLQVLYLDYCNISNDVMVALTDSLYKHCPLLKDLSLNHNHLSSGVWEVLKHIQQMKNLTSLWLGGNPCMEDYKRRDEIETTLQRSNPGLNVRLY